MIELCAHSYSNSSLQEITSILSASSDYSIWVESLHHRHDHTESRRLGQQYCSTYVCMRRAEQREIMYVLRFYAYCSNSLPRLPFLSLSPFLALHSLDMSAYEWQSSQQYDLYIAISTHRLDITLVHCICLHYRTGTRTCTHSFQID